jgi:hypothetical protein
MNGREIDRLYFPTIRENVEQSCNNSDNLYNAIRTVTTMAVRKYDSHIDKSC